MSQKHSIASKKRWAKVPLKERRQKMAMLALDKWNKMSKKDQQKHLLIMLKGKKKLLK